MFNSYSEHMSKRTQLQIRVSESDKKLIRLAAKNAGVDMSAYILQCVLTAKEREFRQLLATFETGDRTLLFAELIDFLSRLSVPEISVMHKPQPELERLDAYTQNYVCALFEQRCEQLGVPTPGWVGDTAPLEYPVFGTNLRALRPYLLINAPAAFKRRNIFVDSGVGDRV
ncbi:MAG: hypothetical protein DHS20C11_04420 [Lysobacteraceae bacterium]|nr:MAG: hypothetical protein DHS20C11_04420 [Xanthomonadaceae bacterium]